MLNIEMKRKNYNEVVKYIKNKEIQAISIKDNITESDIEYEYEILKRSLLAAIQDSNIEDRNLYIGLYTNL